ncbi:MAG: asparagine--tRNA ligase, partial [Thermoplasmata archaeon]|nr:asparagine--tRNA ligase [Thermoplasmata archaeon]
MTEFQAINNILSNPSEGKKVRVRGWIHRIRKTGKLIFAVIRNESGIIQAILFRDNLPTEEFELAKSTLIESSVVVEGRLAKDERAPGGYEIRVEHFEVVGAAEKFPITKDQSDEFLLDNRHLWLRSRRMSAILKVRSTIFNEIRNYFQGLNYYEVQSPVFQSGACEGGSTLFEVPYFDSRDKVYLTQSWQLYAEAMMFGLERIYTIGPAFRAEKSRTRRHLTEFWMAEVEAAWLGNAEMMELAEGLVTHLVKSVIEKNPQELEFLERDISILKEIELPFPRYKYAEILDMLNAKGLELEWGADLGYTEEKMLTQELRT